MSKTKKYSPEVRERPVRMVLDHQHKHPSLVGGHPLHRGEDRLFDPDAWHRDKTAWKRGSVLPVKSPWLNPIEPKWLHGRRAVCKPERLLNAQELKERICRHYWCELREPIIQHLS